MALELEEEIITEVSAKIRDWHEMPVKPPSHQKLSSASVFEAPSTLLECFLRLLQLPESPVEQNLIAPLIKEELYLRILTSTAPSLFVAFFMLELQKIVFGKLLRGCARTTAKILTWKRRPPALA